MRNEFAKCEIKTSVFSGRKPQAGNCCSGVLVVRDPEQVRKLAGWGLTQNDIARFVGWSQSLISLGF